MAVEAILTEKGNPMRRLLIPVILLVAIIAVWLIQSNLEEKRITGKTVENFLSLSAADINKITVITSRDSLNLQKNGESRFLQGTMPRRADTLAINNILAQASGIKVGNVVSQNPQRQAEFMVGDNNGILVHFYRDDELLNSLIIGKMSNDYAHTYVRKPGSNDVYIADGGLTYTFNRQPTQWLDKTIFSFVPGTIESIEFVYQDKACRLSRGDSYWYISKRPYSDSLMADSLKTRAFVGQINRIVAADFTNATDSGMIDFGDLSLTLTIKLVDGTTHTLRFARVNENSNRIYCRKPDFDDTFVIYKSKFDSFKKEFSDFLP